MTEKLNVNKIMSYTSTTTTTTIIFLDMYFVGTGSPNSIAKGVVKQQQNFRPAAL